MIASSPARPLPIEIHGDLDGPIPEATAEIIATLLLEAVDAPAADAAGGEVDTEGRS